MHDNNFQFRTIGKIISCYKEKFGIPRQSGLVDVPAIIEVDPDINKEAFSGLEDFSHLWIMFVFHAIKDEPWRPTVRPPRLGGNARVGVFASRSMFRPNPIGISVVKLLKIGNRNGRLQIHISGGDFLNDTPVLDIKPYLAYSDSICDANSGFAKSRPVAKLEVDFSKHAIADLRIYKESYPELEKTIIQILELDPRPAYQANNDKGRHYAMKLYDMDIKWQVEKNIVTVLAIEQIPVKNDSDDIQTGSGSPEI